MSKEQAQAAPRKTRKVFFRDESSAMGLFVHKHAQMHRSLDKRLLAHQSSPLLITLQ